MKLPRPLARVIENFERLPGVGRRSAERLAFFLLRGKSETAADFADALAGLHAGVTRCEKCGNISEQNICPICADPVRGSDEKLCVVAEPLDLVSLENTGIFKGRYAVLNGLISPLDRVGPEDLALDKIFDQIRAGGVAEAIFALDPSPEGEATFAFLAERIRAEAPAVRVSRLGRGLPSGGSIEFADPLTLARALEGRG